MSTRHHRPALAAVAILVFSAASAAGTMGLAARHLAPAASAQQGPPPNGRRGNMMGKLLLSLNLTDDQKAKVRQISADMRKQNQSVTDPQIRRANYKKMSDQIEAILTPAQDKVFKAKMAEMR